MPNIQNINNNAHFSYNGDLYRKPAFAELDDNNNVVFKYENGNTYFHTQQHIEDFIIVRYGAIPNIEFEKTYIKIDGLTLRTANAVRNRYTRTNNPQIVITGNINIITENLPIGTEVKIGDSFVRTISEVASSQGSYVINISRSITAAELTALIASDKSINIYSDNQQYKDYRDHIISINSEISI